MFFIFGYVVGGGWGVDRGGRVGRGSRRVNRGGGGGGFFLLVFVVLLIHDVAVDGQAAAIFLALLGLNTGRARCADDTLGC